MPTIQPPTVCKSCGSAAVEKDYAAPLCRRCRDRMACRPLPMWINLVAAGVALVMIFALIRFPPTLAAGVAYQRGLKDEAHGDHRQAVTEFQKVVRRFPSSTEALARLAIAEYHAGDDRGAALLLHQLGGREAPSQELLDELNGVGAALEQKYGGGQQRQAPEGGEL